MYLVATATFQPRLDEVYSNQPPSARNDTVHSVSQVFLLLGVMVFERCRLTDQVQPLSCPFVGIVVTHVMDRKGHNV